jgi:hypothetical protein
LVLFEVISSKTKAPPKYIAAATEEQALRKVDITKGAKVRASPVSVKALTDRLGHNAVHKIFAEHGYTWVCKEGKVFFQETLG